MKRKIEDNLLKWKKDINRRPLMIYGNKQVGKTYSVLKFGEEYYKNVAYFNTENNIEIYKIFKKERTIDRIITHLSMLASETILEEDTLIVFDNLNDDEIVNGIKVFGRNRHNYHIILITSLKENLKRFKGEEFQYRMMTNVDFEEYLIAINNAQLIDFIKASFKNNEPMPFHSLALEYFDDYLATGGMPEAVELSINNKNHLLLNSVYDKVMDTYKKELSSLDNLIDITRSIEVLDSVPFQLQKPNKKFQYGLIKTGGRSKDYEKAINFLYNNGFVYKSHKISNVKSPLSSCKDLDNFKLYLNDTGILFSKMYLNKNKFLTDNRIKYTIIENMVAITLVNAGYNLYYYQSEGKAEVNFVVQTRIGKVIPIEIVNKNMSKAKSLTLFMNKFDIKEAVRVTEDNFSIKKGVKYIPTYALFCLSDIL
ncbi:MAG: ATP-binding protein [Bacilli bacterium]